MIPETLASNDPIGSNDHNGEFGGGDYDDGCGQTMMVKKLSTVCCSLCCGSFCQLS